MSTHKVEIIVRAPNSGNQTKPKGNVHPKKPYPQSKPEKKKEEKKIEKEIAKKEPAKVLKAEEVKIARALDVGQGASPADRELDYVPPNSMVVDMGAASAMVYNSPLNLIASMLVAKGDSLSQKFYGSVGTSISQITPQQAKMAMIAVALRYLVDRGVITTPALVATIGVIDKDAKVPTPFAKALQHYAPYISPEGITHKFTDSTAALPAMGVSGSITNVADMSWGPVEVWGTLAGTYELAVNAATAATWAFIWANASAILEQFATIGGMNCIEFSQIPTTAPDASAYAGLSATYGQAVSATSRFDPEVSLFLSPVTLSPIVNVSSNQKSFRPPVTPATARNSLDFSLATYLCGNLVVGWIETLLTCSWKKGTVKSMLQESRLGRGKLTTFVSEVLDMNLNNWHHLVGAEINRAVAEGYITNTTGVFVTGVCLESTLVARLQEWSYIVKPTFCRTIAPGFRSLSVPPLIALFLGMIGPVIKNGRLRLVLPLIQGRNWPGVGSANGFTAATSPSLKLWQNIFSSPATFTVPVGGYPINSTNFPQLDDYYPLTPVQMCDDFTAGYAAYMGMTVAGRGGVTADVNKSFGGISNLAYVTYGANTASPPTFVAGGTTVVRIQAPVSGICSDVSHGKSDAALSLFMGIIACPADARFIAYQLKNFSEPGFIGSLVAAEDGEDLKSTLAFVRARFAQLKSVGGESADPSGGGNALFASLVSVLAPVLANIGANVFKTGIGKIASKFGGAEKPMENTEYSVMGKQVAPGDLAGVVEVMNRANPKLAEMHNQFRTRARNAGINLDQLSSVLRGY